MGKPITKSLFVDYCDFPKMARWKLHNIKIYKKIRKIETEEQEDHIVSIGQEVEDLVSDYFFRVYGINPISLMPADFKPIIEIEDDEDTEEDFLYTEAVPMNYVDIINANVTATLEAIGRKDKILYQPWFLIDDCFVRADFMLLNSSGQYDLIEVKAKSGIRKEITHEGEKSKVGEIQDKLINDVSFQKYVINQVLSKEWLGELGDVYIYYLNKEYIKNWPIDPLQLVAIDQVGIWSSVTINGIKNDREVQRIDAFVPVDKISCLIDNMRKELVLDEAWFNNIHPFPGNKYEKHFGEDKPFGTVMGRWIHHSKADVISSLYYAGKTQIADLSDDDQELFNWKKDKWTSREFIDRYFVCLSTNAPIIEKDKISNVLGGFKYPICFYDYETISVPIPVFDNSYAYQQVPVQYSLHKYYEDGRIEHFGGVLAGQWTKQVDSIIIDNNPNAVQSESEKVITGSYRDLMDELLVDIGSHINTSTFIVWYEPFENTRNKEVWKIFWDIQDDLLKINENTYDLMEIFSQNLYFDLSFKGSSSIKKVLPVMVHEMDYTTMEIWNWAVAMQALDKIITWQISDPDIRINTIKNLLLYCGQDSLAMLKIFEKLKNIL